MQVASKKRLTVAYVALLHVVLGGVLWKSNFFASMQYRLGLVRPSLQTELTDYYHQTLKYHQHSVAMVPDDAVIFIGDSITQGLAVSAIYPLSVNYGIGGDTTVGVLERLPMYQPALARAKCIVLAVGINDTYNRSAEEALINYETILDTLPQDRQVIVSAVLPVDAAANEKKLGKRVEWRNTFNVGLQRLANEREFVTFVDSSAELDTNGDQRLDPPLHDGGGVHLNAAGNRVWAKKLRDAIFSLPTVN
ncbi:SGNH/GDSL hydrolase family protein [Leptothoe kymatousa]|uniref:SGNH hydrolase-type esterase domain-containing protein n=1 Tax=Leptothoe kymatousa TAU-MAC 1615 TaxID=2364775 RepID=A0ABS5XZI8_9CYAN|nr:GDSL-type esterase/lipase family protein [Leptothoe kymatousa]MBT9311004.1 hypothetical protein [Leptothoe kymatousa TAU-MAC 1615]